MGTESPIGCSEGGLQPVNRQEPHPGEVGLSGRGCGNESLLSHLAVTQKQGRKFQAAQREG